MKYKSIKEEKFSKIYQDYSDDVYRICVYLVKDKKLALEVMQQTFVDFYEFFENVAPESILSYLINIATNLVRSHQKNS